jgi:hypothetical protein
LLDERAFADRATHALAQDEVRDEIATRIGDRLVAAHPELAERRPVLDVAAAALVADPAFAAEFHRGAARMQRALFHDGGAVVRLAVPGAGEELRWAVAARSATTARAVPPVDPELLTLGGGRLETGLRDAAPLARRLAGLRIPALLLGALLLTAAVLRAPTRRRGLRRAAMAVAAVGGVTLAATTIARALVLSTFDTGHGDAVVSEIWSAFLGDLRLWALAAAGVALVLAAAAEPGGPGAWRRALAWLAHPPGAAARVLRAVGLLVIAVLLLAAPEVPLELGLVALAGALVFTAAGELLRMRPLRRAD